MLGWFKKLSFSMRLVLAMNFSMAVVMLSIGISYSYKILGDLEAALDKEMLYDVKMLALASTSLDQGKLDEFFLKVKQNFASQPEIQSIRWKLDDGSSGDILSSSKTNPGELVKISEKNSSGMTFDLAYSYEDLVDKKQKAILDLLVFLVVGMMAFTGVMYFLARYFIKPLTRVASALSSATGKTDANAAKLKEMSSSVQSSGNIISSGSASTTSSMKELSLTIEKSVAELRRSLEIASNVNAKADSGTDVMKKLVSSMEVIEQANNKLTGLGQIFEEISSKTSVINDIVFKTQLLSFNASIEAARAGQHGRGFSVVAEEIGNLAQMSGKSATEISSLLVNSEEQVKSIIAGTDEKIEEGRRVSNQAMASFDEIRTEISEITSTLASVSERSRTQEEAIKATLDTMLSLEETVQEQGIYTRSIGKSAEEIAQESKVLRKADQLVRDLIFGKSTGLSSKASSKGIDRSKVSSLAEKIKKGKAA